MSDLEEFEEWRVTGDPGDGYPKYDFTWSPDRNPHLGDPESAARTFAAAVRMHVTPWKAGPDLSMRWVKRSKWRQVEPLKGGYGRAGGRLPDPGMGAVCAQCDEPRLAHGGLKNLGACPGQRGLQASRFRLRAEDKPDVRGES